MKRHELTEIRDLIKQNASGPNARARLLAYALLREKPYRFCEPVTASMGPMTLKYFRKSLASYISLAVPETMRTEATSKAAVEAWLDVPEPEERRISREKREREARIQNLLRRDNFRAGVMAQR